MGEDCIREIEQRDELKKRSHFERVLEEVVGRGRKKSRIKIILNCTIKEENAIIDCETNSVTVVIIGLRRVYLYLLCSLLAQEFLEIKRDTYHETLMHVIDSQMTNYLSFK